MARRGFTPGGGSARSSQVQRPEPDACVVYYQHAYPLKASFESVIFAFGATKALCLCIATRPCDWTQVLRSQAFDTENCRAADHTGSGPGLVPLWIPQPGLAGVIRLFVVCSGPAGFWFTARFAARFAARFTARFTAEIAAL